MSLYWVPSVGSTQVPGVGVRPEQPPNLSTKSFLVLRNLAGSIGARSLYFSGKSMVILIFFALKESALCFFLVLDALLSEHGALFLIDDVSGIGNSLHWHT